MVAIFCMNPVNDCFLVIISCFLSFLFFFSLMLSVVNGIFDKELKSWLEDFLLSAL